MCLERSERNVENNVYLTLDINPITDSFFYPVKYDIDTGKTVDFLKGIELEGTELIELPYLKQWSIVSDDLAIIMAGKTEETIQLYLVDTKNKSMTSINKLNGHSNITGFKLIGNKLFYSSGNTDCFDYIGYDLTTKKVNILYDDISSCEGSSYTVHFTGGRYDFVQENKTIYLVDELTGERKTVDGLTNELIENSLINEKEDKIMISKYGTNRIEKIGILDINKNSL